MGKIFIVYRSFYDSKGEKLTVGGIQSYIRQLIDVLNKKNLTPIIIQFAKLNFKKKYLDYDVWGIDVKEEKSEKTKSKKVLKYLNNELKENDFIIFATEDLFVPPSTERYLVLQHGVGWDIPRSKWYTGLFHFEFLTKSITNLKRLYRVKQANNIVCVDYNYLNWLRVQKHRINKNVYVIPNSTKIIDDDIIKPKEKLKVIFARRFVEYRGTRLFSNVIKRILRKHSNVYVTFAGEGEDEEYLKDKFQSNSRVNFITYKSEESLEIHKNYNIAVIPTLGSEGTSLSLLEAMATKCAVIATNVGGMTNIVLDHYNGLMINPQEDELYNALEKLILDDKLRAKLGQNAYHTVSEAFSRELWNEKWSKVIDELILDNNK